MKYILNIVLCFVFLSAFSQKKYFDLGCTGATYIYFFKKDSICFYGDSRKYYVAKWKETNDTISINPVSFEHYSKIDIEHYKRKLRTHEIVLDTMEVLFTNYSMTYGLQKKKYIYINFALYTRYRRINRLFINTYYKIFQLDIVGKPCEKLIEKKNKNIKKYFSETKKN